ncbi:MAG: hypothetical protein EOO88_27970 [Pedobacter sp.]|nr:MAG: hypothetical protein EOO88_27970 [Pedobacter sp.]
MKTKNFDQLICRTPAFGANQELEQCWPALKKMIQQSSPAFYDLIQNLEHQHIGSLTERAQFTIWKYFNRAKYRATPFGSFAAVSLMEIGHGPSQIILNQRMIDHHWIDWSTREAHLPRAISPASEVLTNSSTYFVADQVRYIKLANGIFELTSVDSSSELRAVLDHCRTKRSPGEVFEMLQQHFGLARTAALSLLDQLIENQLLHHDGQPNITGKDYFKRLGISTGPSPSDYIIAQRAILSGSFDARLLRDLPDWIEFCTVNSRPNNNQDLSDFIRSFSQRFEDREISLSKAMDPEIGIGYGNLEQQQETRLANDLKELKKKKTNIQLEYGELQRFLLKKIIAGDSIDLAGYKPKGDQKAMPANTFSVVFHLYQNRPVIENMGGTSANALLGRFTMLGQDFEQYAKEIAGVETSANPDVLFFDIAYHAENKVDNINRRRQLYPHELSILNWSTHPQPLSLSDILVAVENGKTILKSKKYGKRIMPRIPSAYNYTRSDLAVFRFLCDVQAQEVQVDLGIDLTNLFPRLEEYPRVNFRGIIVSPAKWMLPRSAQDNIENLVAWLKEKNISDRFKVGHSDQQLCIDPRDKKDLWALCNYCRNRAADIYLTEALLEEKDQIVDQSANTYCPQYIASYYHDQQLYAPSPTKPQEPTALYPPGSKWLYLEIYVHPSATNSLLFSTINGTLSKNRNMLKKWFFIRYTDPSAHIRLRLELKDPSKGHVLLFAIQQQLQPQMANGFVSELAIRTYTKETQRYGVKRMELVEKFFALDSAFVLQVLKRTKDNNQLMRSALQSMQWLCQLTFKDPVDQLSFAKKMLAIFGHEIHLGPQGYKKLNADFKLISKTLGSPMHSLPKRLTERWKRSFLRVIHSAEDSARTGQLLADLIHLHINRLFYDEQRAHETIAYHHLQRIFQITLAVKDLPTQTIPQQLQFPMTSER